MMVGADEEMSVTMVRWKSGEERLKKDLEKDIDAEIKKDVLELKKEIKKDQWAEKKEKPDLIFLLLERCIDTILLEEVTRVGLMMSKYKALLAKTILEFFEEHQEEQANLDRLVDAFRAGWKVYGESEEEKATMDVFMKEVNNELWVPEGAEWCARHWTKKLDLPG